MARKRLKKKKLKHAQRRLPRAKMIGKVTHKLPNDAPTTQARSALSFSEADLNDLAVDIWKLEKNIKKAAPLNQSRQIKSSLSKLFSFLKSYGIEVQDHTDEKYYENMNVRVLSFEQSEELTTPMILDTIKPSIIANGKLASSATVIVGMPLTAINNEPRNDEGEDNGQLDE